MSTATALRPQVTVLVRDTCFCLHVHRAARALARRFDEAFRPIGLTSGQFSLLMSLNREDAPDMAAVAALLGMDRTTVTAALKPLRRRRLVSVRPDREDSRRRLLSLTSAGRATLAEAVPVWQRVQAAIEAQLDDRPDHFRRQLRVLG